MYTKVSDFDFNALLTAKKNTIITYRRGVGAFTSLQAAAEGLSLKLGELRCAQLDLLGMTTDIKNVATEKYDVIFLSDFDCMPDYMYGPLFNSIRLDMGEPFMIAGATTTATIKAEWLKYFPESVALIY